MTGISAIDIDRAMGESFGNRIMGPGKKTLPLITAADFACGLCAGDPTVMLRTVRTAAERHGVTVGAHPGHRAAEGFGRRRIPLGPAPAFGTVFRVEQQGRRHTVVGGLCPESSDEENGTAVIGRKITGTDMDFALDQVRQFPRSGRPHTEAGNPAGMTADLTAGGIGPRGDGDRAVEPAATVRQTVVEAGVPVEGVAA
ncbi:LamB/YcsF family protein [Streptomyces sp. H51]|uniref:LamB/YcsF family protein n=1 Tax=Streptomyces sp. H51 TaxID=3111770 RepID=UPI002D7941E3|nr:LamB/YcsF family protein [Streptomyces sp. H51]